MVATAPVPRILDRVNLKEKMNRGYVILSVLTLYNRMNVSEASIMGSSCEGEDTLFIQWWHHLPSGWYHQESFTCGYYRNVTDELSYNFHHEEDGWKLVQWTNFESRRKTVLVTINETLSRLLLTDHSNYLDERILASAVFKTEHQRSRDSNYSRTISETELTQEELLDKDEGTYNGDEDYNGHYDSELKVYYSKRCICRKARLVRFQKPIVFDRLDLHKNLSQCKNLKDYYDILPLQYRKILSTWNISFEEMVSVNTSDNLTRSEDVETNDDMWRPEFYLSKNCEMIYYHSHYDQWHVDSGFYTSASSRLGLFVSTDPAPCVEYLPPARQQRWFGYRRVQYSDYTEEEHLPEVYKSKFTIEKEDNLKVLCVSLEEYA